MYAAQGQGNIMFNAVREEPNISPAAEVGISALPYAGGLAALHFARQTPFGSEGKYTIYDIMQKVIRNTSDATPFSFFNTFRLPEMMSPFLSPKGMGLDTTSSLMDPAKQVGSYELDSKFLQNYESKDTLKAIIGDENYKKISHFMIGDNTDFRLVTEYDLDKRGAGNLIFQQTKEVITGGEIGKVGIAGSEIELGNINLISGGYSADAYDHLENLERTSKINPYTQAVYQNLDLGKKHDLDKAFKSADGELPRFMLAPTMSGPLKTAADIRARSAIPTAHLSMGINRFNRLLSATFNQMPVLGRTLERAMDTKLPVIGNFSLKTQPGPFYKQFTNIGLKTAKLGAAYLGLSTIDHYRRNFDFLGNVLGSAIVAGGAGYFISEMQKQAGKAISKTAVGQITGGLFFGQLMLPGFGEGVVEGLATTAKNLDVGMSVVGKYTGLSYYRRGLEGLFPGFTEPTTGLALGLGVAALSYGGFAEKMLVGEEKGTKKFLSKLMPDGVRSRIGFMGLGAMDLNLRGTTRTREAEVLLDILTPQRIKGEFSEDFKRYNPLAEAFELLDAKDPRVLRYNQALSEVVQGKSLEELNLRDVKYGLKRFFYRESDLFEEIYTSNKTYDTREVRAAQLDATYNISQKVESELYNQKYKNNELNQSLLRRIGEINTRYENPNFLNNMLRRTEIFGAELYHSFFGATLSGEVTRTIDGEEVTSSYDKIAKELQASPLLRRFGILTLGTALLHQVATSGIFGSMQDPQQKIDEYSGRKLVEVKKGRFWEAGGSPYSGGETSYFRPSLYATMMSRAAERSVWGDDTERFNPITKFLLKNFTYHLEEKNYYDRPYPISSGAFKDIPVIGDFLAATIGRVIKPPKLMHQNELVRIGTGGEKQQMFKQEFGSSLNDGSTRQAPASPYNVTSVLGNVQYQFRELEGLTGFVKQTFQDKFTGRKYLGTENLLMAESNEMDSTINNFWDMELGGMAFMSEPIRRLLPRKRSEIETYNPISNSMPSYIPGRFKQGDPYRLLTSGYARLPGKGYEALNPDVAGMDPEDYPDVHKYKILADIAPSSRGTMQLRQQLFERRAAGTTTEHENKLIDDITKYHQKRIAATRNYEQENVLKTPLISDITSAIYGGGEELLRRVMSPAEQAVPGILGFGFRPTAKLLGKTKDVIETYEYERLYGTSNAFWDKPFRDSFRPALYSAANLMGWEGKPLHIQKREQLNEHFDKLQFVKLMRLAQSTDNIKDRNRYLALAGKTRVGVNPNGDALSIYLSLPNADKRFFEAFTQAKSSDRERILEMVPEDQVELYQAVWSRMDSGEDIGLYSGSKPKTDPVHLNRQYQEALEYLADKPMPGADWIGWHKDVDINDIKVKYVQNLGAEVHDYDMWDSQMRRISRRPYLEGSDMFMHSAPSSITSNPYTNMGFGIAKGVFNSSSGVHEKSRSEIVYNDDRLSEVAPMVFDSLRN